ncbi:hypothetical protein LSPH24S_02255 [Lysinibacillus sphaericus]
MTRSYRSTKPIIEFTRKLVPNGERIMPFERDGALPVLTQLSDRAALHLAITTKVEALRQDGYNSIAIICKTAEESKHAFEALSDIEDVKLIKYGSPEYEQGVVIIPSYLSKGIEFEAVIILPMHLSTYMVMTVYVEFSTLPARELCIICNYIA